VRKREKQIKCTIRETKRDGNEENKRLVSLKTIKYREISLRAYLSSSAVYVRQESNSISWCAIGFLQRMRFDMHDILTALIHKRVWVTSKKHPHLYSKQNLNIEKLIERKLKNIKWFIESF